VSSAAGAASAARALVISSSQGASTPCRRSLRGQTASLVILAARDPAVPFLGLPVFLLHALKLIARPGLVAESGAAATGASYVTAASGRAPEG